jgi:hypothetical protein
LIATFKAARGNWKEPQDEVTVEQQKAEEEKEKETEDPFHPQDPVIEVKNDEQETDGTIVEMKVISVKGLKEGLSSSKDRRRNLTEKEEDDKDELWEDDEQMNVELSEEELLRGRYVDEVGEEETSEEDILREAAQTPFEEELLEDDENFLLKEFREELERIHELDEQEEKEKLKKKDEPVELTKTMIFAVPLKTKNSSVVEVVIKEIVLYVERKLKYKVERSTQIQEVNFRQSH